MATAASAGGSPGRRPSRAMAAEGSWTPARSAAGSYNPWLIVVVISLATFMEVLDTAIANVALTHIAGSLAVSEDEATWVLTSYLVANAVVVPISGWLSDVIGRKRFYMMSVAIFTIASILCGFAPNLGVLVVARVVQGIGGGGLAPSEQSIIADTFPPSKRGMAFAAYGVVVIVAPTMGPTLGGWITDNISWHWIFLINGPVGLLSLILVHLFVVEAEPLKQERRKRLKKGLRIDYIGFALVALGLGCLEITLDRGQRDDWFSSPFIIGMAITSAVSLILLVVWELLHDEPIVNIRLLGNRNFAITTFMMLTVGAILFGSTQVLPQMLQAVFGYTATLAGLALTTGGLAALAMMPVVGLLTGRVQTRWILGAALLGQAGALWHMSHLSTDASFHQLGMARLYQALFLPFLFIPITNQAYADLKPGETGDASALLNVARNIGGSIGISAAQAVILQRQQFHQSRIVEGLNPLNPEYVRGLGQAGQLLGGAAPPGDAGLTVIFQQVQQQAAMISYLDVFHGLMVFVLCVVPLAIFLKPAVSKGGGGH